MLSLIKQFTYMHPKDLFMHFQKMVIIYYPMAYSFGDIRVWSRRIFHILIASISWMFVRTPITNINHNSGTTQPYSGRKHENWRNESVSSTFSTLTVCNSLCIICMWSLFCSVRVYISLHFLPTLLED